MKHKAHQKAHQVLKVYNAYEYFIFPNTIKSKSNGTPSKYRHTIGWECKMQVYILYFQMKQKAHQMVHHPMKVNNKHFIFPNETCKDNVKCLWIYHIPTNSKKNTKWHTIQWDRGTPLTCSRNGVGTLILSHKFTLIQGRKVKMRVNFSLRTRVPSPSQGQVKGVTFQLIDLLRSAVGTPLVWHLPDLTGISKTNQHITFIYETKSTPNGTPSNENVPYETQSTPKGTPINESLQCIWIFHFPKYSKKHIKWRTIQWQINTTHSHMKRKTLQMAKHPMKVAHCLDLPESPLYPDSRG